MTAKEFINDKIVTQIGVAGDYILNIFTEDSFTGLKHPDMKIKFGTKLVKTKEFTVENDTLRYKDLSIDLAKIEVLKNKKIENTKLKNGV
jgi:hypothetical protein